TAANLEVTYNASDAVKPTLAITSPTTSGLYSASQSVLNVAGSASDNVGVQQITWSNDRGGNGVATGTTSWACNIALQQGSNEITITDRDAAGNLTNAHMTVSYTPSGNANPTISISSPTKSLSYSTSTDLIALTGSASSDVEVTQITWSNDRGGSGVAS